MNEKTVPQEKYQPFPPVDLPGRKWPGRKMEKAPRWCSVDLRDGNQALETPMSVDEKIDLFTLLVERGFTEIEVGFPSASQTEHAFTRALIERDLIPDNVTIQVLTQAREDLIRKTFEEEGERAMALGLWGTVGAAGAAVGPLIGGALLEQFWWGSVFLINVPVMLIVAPTCWLLLPRIEQTTPGKWPIGQALLLIVGMISVVYAIKAGFGAKQPLPVVVLVLTFGIAILTLFARKQLRATAPMLDLSLLSHPTIVAGLMMAIVASGALAGVELTLAQELQYVLAKTPLQAGLFMIPIMAAAALGGPVAGYLSNRFGLRRVASLSLLISGAALLFLAQSDFHQPGALVPLALAVLGLTLSIGLTASSIAIMGAIEASKGGAAGALEATGYELGTGLGIAFFGMFMSGVFSRAIELPDTLPSALAAQAAQTIGDTYIVANQLGPEQAAALIEAGKTAFSQTHSVLLTTSAIVIATLAVVVFIIIAPDRRLPVTSHH